MKISVTFVRVTRKFIVILCLLGFLKTQAQLGFCTGNSGDPIVEETFGEGSTFGELPNGSSTSYRYINSEPHNGFYTVSSSSFGWFEWHNIPDHTLGDTNGRMLIVNAGRIPGEFFRISVSGLCENTSYEFSSWLVNLLPANFDCPRKQPINVRFEIWDSTDSVRIKSGDTGNIYSSSRPNWQQHALVFKTKPGQTSVILKMRNNGVGGCGNDLAIDDIMFRTCGDAVFINDISGKQSVAVNKNDLPFSTTLSAVPDFSVFSSHAFQWQKSTDGIQWEDILGETNKNYTITSLNKLSYYRVRVAEDEINLSNPLCNYNSEFFEVKIIEPKTPPKTKPVKKVKRPTIQKIEFLVNKGVENDEFKIEQQNIVIPVITKEQLAKTYKRIIIVKEGLNVINNKVWIDGAIGKYVQTSEEVVKQGDPNGVVIIDEIVYYKAIYGYNTKTRRYRIE
ncbi:hypothetical protein N1F78_05655 [Seonamhaeicola sp. MEBiC1930]|uniref:hypothetical protein n=1 Tax=Seonamhaeicola sp. MEBiC01930 TaxID=2976768 RepID=UPI00324FE81F